MQSFYRTTLESKFIKYLLSVTPLPLVSYIQDNDIMIIDNYYLYMNRILRCTRTGIFKGSRANKYDYLTVGDLVYCQDEHDDTDKVCDNCLTVTDKLLLYGGRRMATYEVISEYTFGQYIPGITENFISTTTYYDPETHKRLGDYLRLIYATQGVQLMSLYNCFCNKFVNNVNLCNGFLEDVTDPRYKVTLVPIKFNRTYTIAVDCSSPIYIKPVIYKGNLLKDTADNYIFDGHYSTIKKFGYSRYSYPITYKVENYDTLPQQYEQCLYLAIQLPKNNRSAITVLEGNYTNYNYDKVFDAKMYNSADYSVINDTLTSALSMLQSNPADHYTYSDKLISYLLQNTIDDRECLGGNIKRVQEGISWYPHYRGYWDEELRARLYKKYMELRKTRDELNYTDILGYVDVDIENSLNRGFMRSHGG